jgi:hypothetical protein
MVGIDFGRGENFRLSYKPFCRFAFVARNRRCWRQFRERVFMDISNAEKNRAKTIPEWCKARRLSRSTYHKLKKLGRGPKELEIPGTRIKRITPEADAEWEARMAELAKSETAQLEAERRRAQAAEAGKLAAQSPNHVSRRTTGPGRARANRRDEVAR